MQSSFSAAALNEVDRLLAGADALDFTRCVRPNGTAYGTAGQCRKGVERPEEETERQDREKRQVLYLADKRYADDPERKAKVLNSFVANGNLADKIRELDDGNTVIISNHMNIHLDRKLNDIDSVSLTLVGRADQKVKEISFTANGELDYGSIEDPKDRVKAALTVRKLFTMLTKALTPGDMLYCYAWDEDGREQQREKAYKKIGFQPQADGSLLGEVQSGGGVAFRAEPTFSESKGSWVDWYVAMFGELPRRGPSKAP
jgi:hypothetical protein